MRERYRLQELGNDDLLAALSRLVRQGNDLTSDLLAHLAELDERRLHLNLGFSSLFAYCTEALGLCESAAGRRIAAARVCRRFPEAFALVARGQLHLSALCALSAHLNPDNAPELFAACACKTRRQVDEVLAARFPKPDVHTQIRRLPGKLPAQVAQVVQVVEAEAKKEGQLAAASPDAPAIPCGGEMGPTIRVTASATNSVVRTMRAAIAARRSVEPLSVDRYGFHFTGDARLKAKIERARSFARHRLPSGDMAALVELAFDRLLRDLEKQRFAVGRTSRRFLAGASGAAAPADSDFPPSAEATEDSPPPGGCDVKPSTQATGENRFSPAKRMRRVPAAVARDVFLRDQGRCSVVSEDGRCCGSQAFLELDHLVPWAEGGDSTSSNLRLRCRAHNQQHARNHFGAAYIEARIARSRREGNMRPARKM